MRKSRLRLFAPLLMVFALVGAACANDNSSSNGGTSGSGGATGAPAERPRRSSTGSWPTARSGSPPTRRTRRSPHTTKQRTRGRASTSTWPRRSRSGWVVRAGRLADAVLGHHHRGELERSVGRVGRLHDRHGGSCQGARFHRPVLLHARRSRGAAGTAPSRRSTSWPGRRSASAAPAPMSRTSTETSTSPATPRPTSFRTTSRSRPTTRTRPPSRTWRSGRLDAVMSAVPTLQGAIDKGKPIQLLGDPVFFEPLAVAVDKSAPLDRHTLVQKIYEIIDAMHDGRDAHPAVGEVVRGGPDGQPGRRYGRRRGGLHEDGTDGGRSGFASDPRRSRARRPGCASASSSSACGSRSGRSWRSSGSRSS